MKRLVLCPWCDLPVKTHPMPHIDRVGRVWHPACAEACSPGSTTPTQAKEVS